MANRNGIRAINPNTARVHRTGMRDQCATETSLTLCSRSQIQESTAIDQQTYHELTKDAPAPAPQANFPLPRELRDQIYGYLLDGKHTRVTRVNRNDKAYKFHTNIMAVNRQIHREAERYLYKNNIFVVFRSDILPLPRFEVPVVAFGRRNMKHLSLDVTFFQNYDPHSPPENHQITHLLLLAKDLGIYCHWMGLCNISSPSARRITLGTDGSIYDRYNDEEGNPLNPAYLRLVFGGRLSRKVSPELHNALLSYSRNWYGFNTRVRIVGYAGNTSELHRLRENMNSSLICRHALLWNFFRGFEDIKIAIDESAELSEFRHATCAYGIIFDLSRFFMRWLEPRHPSSEILSAFRQLAFDVALTKARLELKNANSPAFVKTVTNMSFLPEMRHQQPPSAFLPHVAHVQMLAAVASKGFLRLPSLSIDQVIASLQQPGSDIYQLRDAAILKSCPDLSKVFAWDDWPNASCSFHDLSFKPVDLRKLDRNTMVPNHIVGLLDLKMLRETDQHTREEINRLQAERGWKITPFESYDAAS